MIKPPKFLFNHIVVLRGFAGNNAYGEKVYTLIDGIEGSMIISALPNGDLYIKGRFEPTKTTNRSERQEQKQYIATFFTLGTDIPPQSTIDFEGNRYIVAECIKQMNLDETSYLEVRLQ